MICQKPVFIQEEHTKSGMFHTSRDNQVIRIDPGETFTVWYHINDMNTRRRECLFLPIVPGTISGGLSISGKASTKKHKTTPFHNNNFIMPQFDCNKTFKPKRII